jgi:hypothetical protein
MSDALLRAVIEPFGTFARAQSNEKEPVAAQGKILAEQTQFLREISKSYFSGCARLFSRGATSAYFNDISLCGVQIWELACRLRDAGCKNRLGGRIGYARSARPTADAGD